MKPILRRFDRGAACPKCGSVGATAKFLRDGVTNNGQPVDWASTAEAASARVERIRRDCTTCGFWWLEAPIDAAEVST